MLCKKVAKLIRAILNKAPLKPAKFLIEDAGPEITTFVEYAKAEFRDKTNPVENHYYFNNKIDLLLFCYFMGIFRADNAFEDPKKLHVHLLTSETDIFEIKEKLFFNENYNIFKFYLNLDPIQDTSESFKLKGVEKLSANYFLSFQLLKIGLEEWKSFISGVLYASPLCASFINSFLKLFGLDFSVVLRAIFGVSDNVFQRLLETCNIFDVSNTDDVALFGNLMTDNNYAKIINVLKPLKFIIPTEYGTFTIKKTITNIDGNNVSNHADLLALVIRIPGLFDSTFNSGRNFDSDTFFITGMFIFDIPNGDTEAETLSMLYEQTKRPSDIDVTNKISIIN